jgi:hypothetical protein
VTPQQVRDLLHSLLQWRRAQGGEPVIESVVPAAPNRLVITFADSRAVVTVSLHRRIAKELTEKG